MTNREYSEYLKMVAIELNEFSSWRPGQAYFNTLYYMFPEIAETYRGTSVDPFYRDERIPKFLSDLYSNHVL